MIEMRNFTYIAALPGDTVDDVARRAIENGVTLFVHNDSLYRAFRYEKIGTVRENELYTAGWEVGSNHQCKDIYPGEKRVRCIAAKGHMHIHFGWPEGSFISGGNMYTWENK